MRRILIVAVCVAGLVMFCAAAVVASHHASHCGARPAQHPAQLQVQAGA